MFLGDCEIKEPFFLALLLEELTIVVGHICGTIAESLQLSYILPYLSYLQLIIAGLFGISELEISLL